MAPQISEDQKVKSKFAGKVVLEDGWVFDNEIAAALVEEARKLDPKHAGSKAADRDQAVALYSKSIESQPGANSNAKIAERIAQLYSHYEDRDRGVTTDFDKGAEWWKRCINLTEPTQFLWARAQMGLASTQFIQNHRVGTLSSYDKILGLDPATIEFDNWRVPFDTSMPRMGDPMEARLGDEELLRKELQQRLIDLQDRIRTIKKPYVEKVDNARHKANVTIAKYAPPDTSRTINRSLVLWANLLVVLSLFMVLLYRRARR